MLRITMMMGGQSKDGKVGGWSESWYHDGELPTGLANNVADGLVAARAKLMAVNLFIVSLRETEIDADPLGSGKALRSMVWKYGTEGAEPGGKAKDLLNVSLSCKITSAVGKSTKSFTLPGVPDDYVTQGSGNYPKSFTDDFRDFCRFLVDNNFKYRMQDQTEAAVNIVSISDAGVVMTAANHGAVGNQYVQVMRARNSVGKKANGLFKVAAGAAGTGLTLLNWTGGTVGAVGTLRRRKFVYAGMVRDSQILKDITTRPIGRPFNQFHGRRRKGR